MQKTVASTLVASFIAALTFASNVQADDAEGAFMGGGVGWSNYADIDGMGLSTDKNATSYRLFGGYTFNQYWGVEAGYNWLGDAKVGGDTYRANGVNLSVIPRYPLTDKFAILGELGLMFSDVKNDNFGTSDNGTNGVFGLGAAYRVSDPLDLQLRYRIYQDLGDSSTGKSNVHNVSLEAVYYPTRTTYVAPAPEPAPEPTPEPVIETKTFTLSSDVMFDFNKASLKSEGMAALDQLYTNIKAEQPTDGTIVVYGYTDRIGSEKYNQTLSEKRAQTVADYFVQKGIPTDKVSAVGRGEANSVTGSSCDGVKKRKDLIVCLAPDRRVNVEVTGTKQVTTQP